MAKYAYNVRIESNDFDSIAELLDAANYDYELLHMFDDGNDDGIQRGLAEIKDREQEQTNEIKQTLDGIWAAIQAGHDISMGEIVFLQEHQDEIKKYYPNDPLLWEWANIPESEFVHHDFYKTTEAATSALCAIMACVMRADLSADEICEIQNAKMDAYNKVLQIRDLFNKFTQGE